MYKSIIGIWAIVILITGWHYLFSSFDNFYTSIYVGIVGGFGALFMDIYKNVYNK